MFGHEKRKSSRNTALILDVIHIIVGIIIVILAVVFFLNPEQYMVLFPIIFLMAAFLNIVNGVHRVRQSGREKKKKLSGIALTLFGILLLFLTVTSAISIWWR